MVVIVIGEGALNVATFWKNYAEGVKHLGFSSLEGAAKFAGFNVVAVRHRSIYSPFVWGFVLVPFECVEGSFATLQVRH